MARCQGAEIDEPQFEGNDLFADEIEDEEIELARKDNPAYQRWLKVLEKSQVATDDLVQYRPKEQI